jgi:hypothetical protein
MLIPTPCSECFLRDREIEKREGRKFPLVMLPGRMTDHGYIEVTCGEGHKTTVIYDERKFELLFQSACHTLNAGYEREAVSGFATSLEQLYEFFIRVVCRKTKLTADIFEKTWKQIARQSERQFGCFLMLYSINRGKSFDVNQKQIEFRNRVIHQGYIPKRKEAFSFGKDAWRIKRSVYKFLERKFPKELKAEIEDELKRIEAKVPKGRTILKFKSQVVNVDTKTNIGYEIENFEEFLDGMKRRWEGNT